ASLGSGVRGFTDVLVSGRLGTTAGTDVTVVGAKLGSGVRGLMDVLVSGGLGTTAGADVTVVGAKLGRWLGALLGALHCLDVNGRCLAQAIEQSDRSRREWWRKCRGADGTDRKGSDDELTCKIHDEPPGFRSVEAVLILGLSLRN